MPEIPELKEDTQLNTFFLVGVFDEEMFVGVSKWILEENKKNRFKELNLIINSIGGHLSACFGIIDVMNGSKIPINTIGIGEVASCGFTTFINGKNRILTPNTMCLSHDFASYGIGGKYHELISDRKIQDFAEDRIRSIYKKCCRKKLSDKTLNEKLLGTTDRWLYPQEVKDLGFCDEIKFLN